LSLSLSFPTGLLAIRGIDRPHLQTDIW
jgi:hypothetical protein